MPYLAASNVAIGPDDVAITLGYGALGTHLGIAFQDDDRKPVIIDLAFHRIFRETPYPGHVGQWSAAIVPLPPFASASLVAILRAMRDQFAGKHGAGPNYGINLKLGQGAIGEDKRYVPPPGSDGHTCATIIAEAFRAARLPLVDLDTWQPSEENVIWGNAIACMLRAYAKVRPESQAFGQVKAVQANNQGFRLLPEEVAAAGQLPAPQRPAPQGALANGARQAAAQMRAACVPPEDPGIFEKCAKEYETKLAKLEANRKAAADAQAVKPGSAGDQQAAPGEPPT